MAKQLIYFSVISAEGENHAWLPELKSHDIYSYIDVSLKPKHFTLETAHITRCWFLVFGPADVFVLFQ